MAERRLLAPEVVQTSAMDCGPAALKCLLEGFGIPVSYGRLREACQTGVDGTSIDNVELVANQLGLRADQSANRADMALLTEDASYRLLKLNPIFDWSREQVAAFTASQGGPVNPLHDRNFASIGCAPCTRALRPGEPERAGRWWWEEAAKKECGLHGR